MRLIFCFNIFPEFCFNSLDEGFDGETIMSLSVEDLIGIGLKKGQRLKLFILSRIYGSPFLT